MPQAVQGARYSVAKAPWRLYSATGHHVPRTALFGVIETSDLNNFDGIDVKAGSNEIH
jgi:hypothetical protein